MIDLMKSTAILSGDIEPILNAKKKGTAKRILSNET